MLFPPHPCRPARDPRRAAGGAVDGSTGSELKLRYWSNLEKHMARHRLSLSISPELKHALDELNAATGVAAASFVGEIIEGNIPMILALAEAARKAKAEPAKALELMQRYLIEASQEVDQTQLELAEQQSKLRPFTKKDTDQ